MEVIGEKLKTSREEKGLSLEEVCEDLKMDFKDLQNIELGNRKEFNDVYELRDYISEYAKYLGLDYEAIVEEFNEFMFEYTSKIPVEVIERISKQKEKEEKSKAALSPYTIDNSRNNKKMITIIAVVVLLLCIILSVVFITRENDRNEELSLSALI